MRLPNVFQHIFAMRSGKVSARALGGDKSIRKTLQIELFAD
jgi:hypothetical protein